MDNQYAIVFLIFTNLITVVALIISILKIMQPNPNKVYLANSALTSISGKLFFNLDQRSDSVMKKYILDLIKNPEFTHEKYNQDISQIIISDEYFNNFQFLNSKNKRLIVHLLKDFISELDQNYNILKNLVYTEKGVNKYDYDAFAYNKLFNQKLSQFFNSIDPVNHGRIIDDIYSRIFTSYYGQFDFNDKGLYEQIDIRVVFNKDQLLDFYLFEVMLNNIIYSESIERLNKIEDDYVIMEMKMNRIQYFNLRLFLKENECNKIEFLMNEKIH
jgi:hypothetical protein